MDTAYFSVDPNVSSILYNEKLISLDDFPQTDEKTLTVYKNDLFQYQIDTEKIINNKPTLNK